MTVDTSLLEVCPDPLGLLGGDGDRSQPCLRSELGCGLPPAQQRLRLHPAKGDCILTILTSLPSGDLEKRVALDRPQPLNPDHRQTTPRPKLRPCALCRG